ncbi:hypothetical protein RSAG8_01937, partial [Rhizoctonia solani AG-8 WAC10335]
MRPDYLNGARLLSFGVFIALLIKINPNAGGVIDTSLRKLSPNLELYIYPSVSSLEINRPGKAMIYVEREHPGNPLMNIKANASGSIEAKKSGTASVSSLSKDVHYRTFRACNRRYRQVAHSELEVQWLIVWYLITSLLGFAVVINSARVFYSGRSVADAAAATMFAVALLCSRQSNSITATVAGQIVRNHQRRIHRTSPLVRRVNTRLIGLVPLAVVAVTVGRQVSMFCSSCPKWPLHRVTLCVFPLV